MLDISIKGLTRINKTVAKNLYNKGFDIMIIPCNINPASPWAGGSVINCYEDQKNFDRFVNDFTFYNCHGEAGLYPAFYYFDKIHVLELQYNDGSHKFIFNKPLQLLDKIKQLENKYYIISDKQLVLELYEYKEG